MSISKLNGFDQQRVLITGGTGFIGANLAARLVRLNAEVHLLVREGSSLDRLEAIKHQVTFHLVDFRDAKGLTSVIQKVHPQYVFNFAHPSALGLSDGQMFSEQIQASTLLISNLLTVLQATCPSLTALVHGGSAFVYEWSASDYLLSERTPLIPSTYRGLLKLNERNICLSFAKKHHLPIRIARIFRVYGPWDHEYKLIIKVLKAIQANESIAIGQAVFKRDYIYVEDLIDGVLALAQSTQPPGFEVNLGSGTQYSAPDIVASIENIVALEVNKTTNYPPNQYDKGNFVADISLAQTELGWSPQHTLEEGLKKTIEWFKNYYKWSPIHK